MSCHDTTDATSAPEAQAKFSYSTGSYENRCKGLCALCWLVPPQMTCAIPLPQVLRSLLGNAGH